MPDHAQLVAVFARALTARSIESMPVDAFAGDDATVRRRLGIYRGNVQANAHKALRAAYPIVARIVGDEFFAGLSNAFAAAVPSASGDLNEYGAEFAAFIASFEPASALAYLPDVAGMEWLVHRAHYAADAPPLDLSRLADVAPERYGDLRFRIAPGVALRESRWPIARIWEVHQPGFGDEFSVDLDAGPERALVLRPRFRVQVRALSPGAFAFLRACDAGDALADAVARAQATEPAWRPDAELPRLVADRVLVDFALP